MTQPSNALRRIFRSAGKSDITSRDLGVLVAEIPGMAQRMRRYVRAFYGYVGGDLNDPVRAAVVLGPRVVLDLTIQQSMVEYARNRNLPDALNQAFWSDCIRRALAARLLADTQEGLPVDTAFTAALAMEFGIIALLRDNVQCLTWAREIRYTSGEARLAAEKEAFGRNRVEAFVQIGRAWEFPENLLYVVANHENRDKKHPPGAQNLCDVIVLSNMLGQALTSGQASTALEEWVGLCNQRLGIDPTTAWEIVEEVLAKAVEVGEALGVPVERQPTVEELCAGLHGGADPEGMSREELLEWTKILLAESESNKEELGRLREEISEAGNTDHLTELGNHNKLLARCGDVVAEAARTGANVCLLHLDIDGFTKVNMYYGYGVGDRILKGVAASLGKVWRDATLIARVGPDSFVGLFQCEERDGRLHAERARATVEKTHVVLDTNQRVRVTATVAGVCRVPDRPEASQEILGEVFKLAYDGRDAGESRTIW